MKREEAEKKLREVIGKIGSVAAEALSDKDRKECEEALDQIMGTEPHEPGEQVWCVDEEGEDVTGYFFMATCGDYVIVMSHYFGCDSLGEQLQEMYEESLEEEGVNVYMFRKDDVYDTYEEGMKALEE